LYPDPNPENNPTYTEPGANTMHHILSYNGKLNSVPPHGHRTRPIGSTLPAYSIVSHTSLQVPDTRNDRPAIDGAGSFVCVHWPGITRAFVVFAIRSVWLRMA